MMPAPNDILRRFQNARASGLGPCQQGGHIRLGFDVMGEHHCAPPKGLFGYADLLGQCRKRIKPECLPDQIKGDDPVGAVHPRPAQRTVERSQSMHVPRAKRDQRNPLLHQFAPSFCAHSRMPSTAVSVCTGDIMSPAITWLCGSSAVVMIGFTTSTGPPHCAATWALRFGRTTLSSFENQNKAGSVDWLWSISILASIKAAIGMTATLGYSVVQ
mmetsp:Transcript_29426/g.57582  ORF Transcript_29426/g.57582 Transcript_29426/m.57582 type:complete len:215 (+) Transcript_29426:901-1545(+)